MTITTRTSKGSALTHAEMDTNLTDLRDGVALMVPKEAGNGVKVDSLGTPSYAWHDLVSTMHTDPDSPLCPEFTIFRGTTKSRQFAEGDEAFIEFHIPHDYVPGTDMLVHAHWSTNNEFLTGGTVTFGFEMTYAKGHNQQAYGAPIIVSVVDAAHTEQYRHQIAEVQFTAAVAAANAFAVSEMEIDGVIMCRFYVDSIDLTVSSGLASAPFINFVDVHYQSSNVGTKNRAPGFYD